LPTWRSGAQTHCPCRRRRRRRSLLCPRAFRQTFFSWGAVRATALRPLRPDATAPDVDFNSDGLQHCASAQAVDALGPLGAGEVCGTGNARCTGHRPESATAASTLAMLHARRLAASILPSGCGWNSSGRRTSAPPRRPVAPAPSAAGFQSDSTNDELSEPVDLSGPDLAVRAQQLGDESVEEAADVAPPDGQQRAWQLAPQQRDNMPRSAGKGRACLVGALTHVGATLLVGQAWGRWHRRRLRGAQRTRSPPASA